MLAILTTTPASVLVARMGGRNRPGAACDVEGEVSTGDEPTKCGLEECDSEGHGPNSAKERGAMAGRGQRDTECGTPLGGGRAGVARCC